MTLRQRIADALRLLADRLSPREQAPEIVSYAEFCQRLKDEREAELRAVWTNISRIPRRRAPIMRTWPPDAA